MIITIDRFEGNKVVVECPDRTMLDLDRSLLPEGAREGDTLRLSLEKITPPGQESLRGRVRNLMKELWRW